MTRFQVRYQVEGQVTAAEVELQVEETDISGEVVLRALGNHLDPSASWPFPSPIAATGERPDFCERAVRLARVNQARKYLRLTHLTYRPEGRVLEFVL